jgi:hypothetical protein
MVSLSLNVPLAVSLPDSIVLLLYFAPSVKLTPFILIPAALLTLFRMPRFYTNFLVMDYLLFA